MTPEERKDRIRRLVLSRRGRLDEAERAARAQTIVERLGALPEVADADPVLAFASFASEVPTTVLLSWVLERGRTLLLPWVAEDGTLRASPVRSLADLEPGYRRIPEPRTRFPVDPATSGVVIVPGVAFDETGGRLGYGGGFYDAFLREASGVPRVGICFELQIVDEVPMEDHDERVDVIVTEERTIRARG